MARQKKNERKIKCVICGRTKIVSKNRVTCSKRCAFKHRNASRWKAKRKKSNSLSQRTRSINKSLVQWLRS